MTRPVPRPGLARRFGGIMARGGLMLLATALLLQLAGLAQVP